MLLSMHCANSDTFLRCGWRLYGKCHAAGNRKENNEHERSKRNLLEQHRKYTGYG